MACYLVKYSDNFAFCTDTSAISSYQSLNEREWSWCKQEIGMILKSNDISYRACSHGTADMRELYSTEIPVNKTKIRYSKKEFY